MPDNPDLITISAEGWNMTQKRMDELLTSHERLLTTLEAIITEVQRCERIQGGAGKETYGYGLIRATARDAIEQARKVKTP
jgi:hypothetical protein